MPVSVKNDYPSEADETLVKWAQQGDTEAFEQLVFRHRDKIYARALMMMRNEDQALEFSQEAWVNRGNGWFNFRATPVSPRG